MKECCEEMAEYVKSIKANAPKRVMFFDDAKEGEPAELSVNTECKDAIIFNLLFRFCPYCGACLTGAKDTGISFLDELRERIFPKELEGRTTLSCRTALLEETLDALQKFFTDEAPKFAKKIQQ